MTETPGERTSAATPKRRNLTRLGLVGVGLGIGLMLAPATVDAAVNYFDTTQTVTTTPNRTLAACPAGTRVTGGGAGPLPSSSYDSRSSSEYQLTGSFPAGNGWQATATVVRGSYSSSSGWSYRSSYYNPKVFAICAK